VNIQVSYNWIKDYLKTKDAADSFARKISLCGPSVERQYPQAPAFVGMVVGRVVGLRSHPAADKLRLAKVDIGKRKIELVCGGTNLAVGMKVVVALPGAKVRWHGEGDLVELKSTEIRGVKSEGMICSANEIGLAEAFPHADREIMDVSWCKSKPGASLAKAFGLDDTVFDIEVTSNRPDAFSVIGLAREAAAISGAKFLWKEPVMPSVPKNAKLRELVVKVAAPKLCTRYEAAVLDGICVGPSPWWLKNRLRMSGVRPINNVVDITNYVMLEYGQPLHAFDYEKVAGAEIVVRPAKEGERLALLDGRTVELTPESLVIADAEKPMAVAGVMGGEDSAVHPETSTIVFESATFDPVSVRRTARRLNCPTDASLRFEKGLPEEQTAAALARAVELCQEIACGRLASRTADERSVEPRKAKFSFRPVKAEELIGVKIPRPKMVSILKSLGFSVSGRMGTAKDPRYEVTVPFWRERDIEDERDFAEEIARVWGYHNLPSVIPTGEIPKEQLSPLLTAEDALRRLLQGAGYTETLNYSLVSREQLEKSGFAPGDCLKLANPLSVEFEFMRPSLIPGALTQVRENQGLFAEGKVFEVSQTYIKRDGSELPDERARLLVLSYGNDRSAVETRFREVKGIWEMVQAELGLKGAELKRDESGGLWHPGRTTVIVSGGTALGTLGEIHPSVLEKFGVDGGVSCLELDLRSALEVGEPGRVYRPAPQFPPVLRDLAFVVDEAVEFGDIIGAVEASSKLLTDASLFDIFRGGNLGAGKKSLALHLVFSMPERTLTSEEADKEVEKIMTGLKGKFGAAMRV
jgi:phenylalanyl-tRNA synthetase beta chain